jgi:hypothetical protein
MRNQGENSFDDDGLYDPSRPRDQERSECRVHTALNASKKMVISLLLVCAWMVLGFQLGVIHYECIHGKGKCLPPVELIGNEIPY